VEDEPTQDRPRRRPVLLAMLVAAALLLAIAGSGAFAGNGGSPRRSDDSTGVSRDAQAAGQSGSGQGFTHRGRHCHHGQQQAPQQDPTGAPPV
jgi:fermentation-respiration switch protein FrsA (DUF1100 family)